MSKIVPVAEAKLFVKNVMTKLGVTTSHAEALADCLVTGDYRGHYSHGLNRLGWYRKLYFDIIDFNCQTITHTEIYIKDVEGNSCSKDGEPTIVKESVVTGLVNGNKLLGPVVGRFSMELAIKKAKETGIGWVVAKGSNHFGIAGYYSKMALDHRLVGMAFTNASPLMAPTRGKKPFFGTNPISLFAPAAGGDDFMLDMATSVVALGKVEVAARCERPIPNNWAVDVGGRPTTDPNQCHALLPLGGDEASSGYKGYGLAMMVEIFTGVLGGAAIAPNIRNWTANNEVANLGQCFIAINPENFAEGFEDRMAQLVSDLRHQEPAVEGKNVMVHGDPEKSHMAKVDQQGGIEYHVNQIKMAVSSIVIDDHHRCLMFISHSPPLAERHCPQVWCATDEDTLSGLDGHC